MNKLDRQGIILLKQTAQSLAALMLLTWSLIGTAEPQKVQVVAHYSNIVTSMPEDPHQAGYAVTIYKREDGLLFGDFTFAAGSTEANGGRLLDLHFANGQIEFKAKTSAYQTREDPSKELFEFKGKVQGNFPYGSLTQWNGYDLRKPVSVQRLKLTRDSAVYPISYEAHQEIFGKDAW